MREHRFKRAVLQRVALRIDFLLAHGRHKQEVAIVGAVGTAEVILREAIDERVGVVIARASIPAIDSGVGAWLNHTVRHHRTGESVSVTAGPDKGIYELSVVIVAYITACNHNGSKRQRGQYFFYIVG